MSEQIVHVVDDDEAVRQSLSFLLASAGFAVRVFESPTQVLEALPEMQPGCLITDLRMPEMSGVELLQRLRELKATLPAIVITGHGDVPMAVEAMKAGALDFIEKPFDDETLLAAVARALDRHRRAARIDEDRSAIAARLDSLSTRERQVLDGLVTGRSNKIIAYDLGISPRTVEVYRAHVMSKMQAKSLSELVRMSLLAVPPGEPSSG